MLPDLPVFTPKKTYVPGGKFLNRLCDRIKKQTPLAGDRIRLEETFEGLVPHAIGGGASASSSMQYSFAASWAGADVRIAAGVIAWTDWGSPSWTDPKPDDWLDEYTVATDDVTVADGDSVWLEIAFPKTDENLIGPLPITGAAALSVTTGGGGAGGDGGGGGAGGDDAEVGVNGSDGDDAVGAAGGAEGGATGTGGGSPGEGSSDPANGGAGGDGASGSPGESVTFDHYTNLRLRARRYGVYSATFVADSGTPTGTATTIYVRIASVSGGVITQHHAGTYHITAPTPSFIV